MCFYLRYLNISHSKVGVTLDKALGLRTDEPFPTNIYYVRLFTSKLNINYNILNVTNEVI